MLLDFDVPLASDFLLYGVSSSETGTNERTTDTLRSGGAPSNPFQSFFLKDLIGFDISIFSATGSFGFTLVPFFSWIISLLWRCRKIIEKRYLQHRFAVKALHISKPTTSPYRVNSHIRKPVKGRIPNLLGIRTDFTSADDSMNSFNWNQWIHGLPWSYLRFCSFEVQVENNKSRAFDTGSVPKRWERVTKIWFGVRWGRGCRNHYQRNTSNPHGNIVCFHGISWTTLLFLWHRSMETEKAHTGVRRDMSPNDSLMDSPITSELLEIASLAPISLSYST